MQLFAAIVAVMLSSSSCENTGSGIPYVNVNYRLVVGNPDFAPLQAIGGWVYLQGGSKGIIVYRASQDEFMAFDRHCTFQPQDNCRVTVDNTHITAVDQECCGSKFILVDGSIVQGPAARGLHQYRTSFDGNTLWITN